MPTIGVSLAVPDPWGRQLQDFRTNLGDPTAPGIPTHITLLPPHEIAEARLPGLSVELGELAARTAPFRVHLRGTGTFRPISDVVFVNVVAGIGYCEQLADGVRWVEPIADIRFPYHPHVTVAHDLPEDKLDRAFTELAGFECSFEVEAFWLYLHDPDAGWRPTRPFPLTG